EAKTACGRSSLRVTSVVAMAAIVPRPCGRTRDGLRPALDVRTARMGDPGRSFGERGSTDWFVRPPTRVHREMWRRCDRRFAGGRVRLVGTQNDEGAPEGPFGRAG